MSVPTLSASIERLEFFQRQIVGYRGTFSVRLTQRTFEVSAQFGPVGSAFHVTDSRVAPATAVEAAVLGAIGHRQVRQRPGRVTHRSPFDVPAMLRLGQLPWPASRHAGLPASQRFRQP